MAHLIGSGRMAVMARLLAPGSISQTITEDVGYNKLAAQYTYKELREADEANLLDEDDMHVFGLKPATDPLNLVCCNACKKPVKASQFAAHAELCKSLSSAEDTVLKLNIVARRKKPPRKERKKSSKVYAIQPTLIRDKEHLETLGSHKSSPSSSHLNEKMQLNSSSLIEAKGNALCVEGLLMMDGSGINNGLVDNLEGSVAPPMKRSKLLAADSPQISDHLGTAKRVTKSLFVNTQEAFICEYRNGSEVESSKVGSGKTSNYGGYRMPRQVTDCYSLTRDVPAPLATKLYYSKRDQRLRSAIVDLYKVLQFVYFYFSKPLDFRSLIPYLHVLSPLLIHQFWPYSGRWNVLTLLKAKCFLGVWLQHRLSIRIVVLASLHCLSTYLNQIARMRSFLDLCQKNFQLVAVGGETTLKHEEVILQFRDKDVFTVAAIQYLHSKSLPSALVALTQLLLVIDINLQLILKQNRGVSSGGKGAPRARIRFSPLPILKNIYY